MRLKFPASIAIFSINFTQSSASGEAKTTHDLTGVYNSSKTPTNLPWNTYNYCNAPHVNAKHYQRPQDLGAELVYLNVVTRHHKVCEKRTRSVVMN